MNGEWKEVTLSTGRVLRVRAMPPLKLRQKVGRRIPAPQPPRKEIPTEIPGGTPLIMFDDQDPDYLAELASVNEERARLVNDFTYLYCVDIPEPPKGWREAAGLDKWLKTDEFREGDDGEKIDYLEYVLLPTTADNNAIERVMIGFEEPDEADIEAAEESFRGEVQGAAD